MPNYKLELLREARDSIDKLILTEGDTTFLTTVEIKDTKQASIVLPDYELSISIKAMRKTDGS